MEYKYDEESVNALMKWAENAQLPKELQLSEAEKIVNLRQYVVANINDIKAHYASVQTEGKTGRRKHHGVTQSSTE